MKKMQVRILNIGDYRTIERFQPGRSHGPFQRNFPVEYLGPGGDFGDLEGNLPADAAQSLPQPLARNAAEQRKQLGYEAMQSLAGIELFPRPQPGFFAHGRQMSSRPGFPKCPLEFYYSMF